MQHFHIHATLDNHDDQRSNIVSHDDSTTNDIKTDDGAHKDSHVAISDNDETQDVTHNIAHYLAHCNTLSPSRNYRSIVIVRATELAISRHLTRGELFSKLSELRSDNSAFARSELHRQKRLEDQALKEPEQRRQRRWSNTVQSTSSPVKMQQLSAHLQLEQLT